MTFKELGLNDEIVSSINAMGFENPTPIQQKAIPYLIEQQGDLIGLASTGTGKTAAFGLPLLHQLNVSSKKTQGLILCPTRELCLQISRDLEDFSSKMARVKIVAVYGGTDITKQIKQIESGAHVIVATPGRLLDLIKRRKVDIKTIETVILDEADEMLNMGFKDDIDEILEQTPATKKVWLFSATMPKEVARIAQNYMHEPFEITVGGKNEGNKNIEHHYYSVKERDRYQALKRIIDFNPDIYGLIFCRTRRDTAAVADKLMAEGYNAEPLHGDLSQAQRDRVMEKFRNKTLQILVATDVAARGIDVDDITHVIHYQLPEDVENYTHRSGRTARAGKTGISIAIIGQKDGRKIKNIEKMINTAFIQKNIPKSDDICAIQLLNFIDKMREVNVNEKEIEKYMPAVMEKLNDLSKEEIIAKFVSTEMNRFLNYYSKSDKISDASLSEGGDDFRPRGDRDRGDRGDRRGSNENFQRFFVNLGKKDGFNHGALLRIVCDNAGVTKEQIGKIDILTNFSFFDAEKSVVDNIVKTLQNVDFEGNLMNVEVTNSKSGESGRGGSRKKPGGRSEGGYKKSEGSGGFRKSGGFDRGGAGSAKPRSKRRSY